MSNLRVNKTSIIGDLIPDIYIDNVILESAGDVTKDRNPHIDFVGEEGRRDPVTNQLLDPSPAPDQESFLSVKIDLLMKDVIEDNILSSWMEQFDFFRYLKTIVILSTDSTLSKVIMDAERESSQMIFGGPAWSTKRRILSFVANKLQSVGLPRDVAHSMCEKNLMADIMAIRTTSTNNRTRQSVEVQQLSNGEQIRNINIRATFKDIPKINPEHLDIFAFTFIDIDSLQSDVKDLDFGNIESLQFATGRFVAQSVIKNGSLVRNAVIFRDQDGSIWSGPVHRMSNGSWMSGAQHNEASTARQVNLERVVLPNITVQDFRNVMELEKNIQDMSFFESVTFPAFDRIFQKRVKENLTVAENSSYFSDLYLSRGVDNAATMYFSFNFDKFAKDNTSYSHILTHKPRLLDNNFEIISFKIIRRRVKRPTKFKNSEIGFDVDSKDVELFDSEEVEKIIVQTRDAGPRILPVSGRATGNSIREIQNLQPNGIRSFSIKDNAIRGITDGFFQYGVEVQVMDSLNTYLAAKSADLSIARKDLYGYLVDAARPFGSRKDIFAPHGNPHIIAGSSSKLRFSGQKGNYNPHTNRFTREFIDKTEELYKEDETKKPWIRIIALLHDVLYLLTPQGSSREGLQGTRWSRDIWTLCSPQTGTPDGIQSVLKIVDNVVAKINLMIGVQTSAITSDSTGAAPENSLSNGTPSLASAAPKKRVYEIKHYFDNCIFDSNILKSTGFHYLTDGASSLEDVSQNGGFYGVRTLSNRQFKDRLDSEVLKYFKQLNPTLPTQELAQLELMSQLASLDASLYGFLSPAIIRTAGQPAILDGTSSDIDITMTATNIMNLKSPPNQPMRSLAPTGQFSRFSTARTNLQNRVIRDNLMDVLADKNCTIEVPLKPPQTLEGTKPLFKSATQEQLSERLSGLRVNLRDFLGTNTQATGQLAESLQSVIDIHTRADGDVFNPGMIFLKIIINFAADNEDLFRTFISSTDSASAERMSISNFDLKNSDNIIEKFRTNPNHVTNQLAAVPYSQFIPQLPIQIKSLFLSSHSVGREITQEVVSASNVDNMFEDENFLNDPVKMISFFLKYMNLMRIEVLAGYETITQEVATPAPTGIGAAHQALQINTTTRTDTHMKSPLWQTLTADMFNDGVNAGSELFCRIRPYSNQSLRISPLKGLQLPIFDQHFIIKPAPLQQAVSAPTIAPDPTRELFTVDQATSEIAASQTSVAAQAAGEIQSIPEVDVEVSNQRQITSDLVNLERTLRGMSREFISTDSRLLSSQGQAVGQASDTSANEEVSAITAPPSGFTSNY